MAEQIIALQDIAGQENTCLTKEQILRHWALLVYRLFSFARGSLVAEDLNQSQREVVDGALDDANFIFRFYIMDNLSCENGEGGEAYKKIKRAYDLQGVIFDSCDFGKGDYLEDQGFVELANYVIEKVIDAIYFVAKPNPDCDSCKDLLTLAPFYTVPEVQS